MWKQIVMVSRQVSSPDHRLAGDGKRLMRISVQRFRDLLAIFPLQVIRSMLRSPKRRAGDHACLQDIVNNGSRLGYQGVCRGPLYRAVVVSPRHDGLWTDPDSSHAIVAEVKTTSAYRIKLDPMAPVCDD